MACVYYTLPGMMESNTLNYHQRSLTGLNVLLYQRFIKISQPFLVD